MISLIDAGPGTGKTYTLVFACYLIKRDIIGEISPTDEQQHIFDYLMEEFSSKTSICCFAHSNKVKDVLNKRLGKKVDIYTFHGAGRSCVVKRYGHQKMNSNRTESIIQALTGQSISSMEKKERWEWLAVKQVCKYLKIEDKVVSEEALEYIQMKYPSLSSYTISGNVLDKAEQVLKVAKRPDGEIDFEDMIWMGKDAVMQHKDRFGNVKFRYDLGIVDESQDIFQSSYTLITRMCKNVLFCGDKNQAINAFTGASEEMYNDIAKKADAIMPLKQTLRCPPHICDLANMIRPGGITPGPNREKGTNRTIDIHSLPGILKGTELYPGNTLIVSRTNAAIIGTTLFLMNQGVEAIVLNKDLGKELKNFIKSFRVSSIPALLKALNAYVDRSKWSGNPLWEHICRNKAECVKEFVNRASDYNNISHIINESFTKFINGYKLTTVHGAKGLEAENVFVIAPPIELPAAMQHPIGAQQETNLHFVAVTRSALNIWWVK